jgi:hypothetical protein
MVGVSCHADNIVLGHMFVLIVGRAMSTHTVL